MIARAQPSAKRWPAASASERKRSLSALLFGMVLAMIALINVIGVSSWHGSMSMHDDAVVAADLIQHDDDQPSLPEIDLHKVTHGMMQGLADLSPQIAFAPAVRVEGIIWFLGNELSLPATPLEGLLRPPRM